MAGTSQSVNMFDPSLVSKFAASPVNMFGPSLVSKQVRPKVRIVRFSYSAEVRLVNKLGPRSVSKEVRPKFG